ncbi:MAG: hypothetical protein AAF614_44545 [Chloroflexota bacterium]
MLIHKLFHLALLLLLVACQTELPTETLDVTPTATSQPLVPTATVPGLATVATDEETAVSLETTTNSDLTQPTATPVQPTATPQPETTAPTTPILSRFGVNAADADIDAGLAAGLPFGLVLNWNMSHTLAESPDYTFWQMIRTGEEEGIKSDWDVIAEFVDSHPGSVWIIGNEPDVRWQDDVTPQRYAELYHEAYTFIKGRDPTAQIATAGIAQSTPLRRAYLDIVLETYEANYGEPMPVDIWTIHAFTLREEKDSWGVDIPPGMDAITGELYEIDQHGDIEIFKQNIIDFRVWMAERGYQERPLAITEFGLIMPHDYGFPETRVAAYVEQTFDFLTTATNETGYPDDNYLLVQQWFWYMLHDAGDYPTGNLYEPSTDQLTLAGMAYRDYVEQLLDE